MPINYFENRPEDSMYPDRINIGDIVDIITKEKQGSKNKEDLIRGKVVGVLSSGTRYKNGVKTKILRLEYIDKEEDYSIDPEVKYCIGRVQYIIEKAQELGKQRDLELQKRFGDIKESEVKESEVKKPIENKPITKPADNMPNIKQLEDKKILKKDHKTEDEKKAVRDWLFGRS